MLGRMRQLIRALVVLSVVGGGAGEGTLAAQSRDELRRKYGEPFSETFLVRPGIGVTSTHAKDGRITELIISPHPSGLVKSRNETLSQDSANEIIDELVPRSARGKYLSAGFVNARCLPDDDCQGSSQDYEKITIYYNSAGQGRVHYVVVQWRE